MKKRFPVSFMLAAALHLFVIFGSRYGFGFITAPEYGLQGSAASMEVYMVAALPEYAKVRTAKSKDVDSFPELLVAKSEMEVEPKDAKKGEQGAKEEDDSLKSASGKIFQKSKVKGDGSSPVPGQSVTTLYAQGSSETDGKAGKYQNPPPQYPFIAERNGWEGVVVLKALIKKEGKPAEVLLEKSSGHKILDEAALKAVKQWKFTAGRIGSIEVASWVKIPVRFTLENRK